MKISKGIFLLLIFVSMLGITPAFANTGTQLLINGEKTMIPAKLEIQEGLIPLRWVAKTIGASDVSWNQGTVTVVIDHFLEMHQYINYQRGLEADSQMALPLPGRLENIKFSSTRINPRPTMINSKALTLEIISQGVSIPYALYDYKIINDTVFVGENWLNTLFLADVKHKGGLLEVSYMGAEEINKKVEKLEKEIKPISPEEAVALWIRGQQVRSGALQYAVLSDELQKKAMAKVTNQLWVTGGSSPSLGEATILETRKPDDHTVIYIIKYNEMLQGEIWNEIEQEITVSREPNESGIHWVITKVEDNNSYYSVLPEE